jgi:hypothetical protein
MLWTLTVNDFLVQIMESRKLPGDDEFSYTLTNLVFPALMKGREVPEDDVFSYLTTHFISNASFDYYMKYNNVFGIYIPILYGNPRTPIGIPISFAKMHHLFPDEIYRALNHPSETKKYIHPILSDHDKELVLNACLEEFTGFYGNKEFPVKIIDEFYQFCLLLGRPENHIKVPSGQYVEKPVHVRPVHDMTNEMAQELTNLPRYTAYAKVIQEKKEQQEVIKRKIKTKKSPEPRVQLGDLFQFISQVEQNTVNFGYVKPRRQIEDEIRRRQEEWSGTAVDEPPPTHFTSPTYSKFTGYGNLSMTSNANSTTYDLYRDVTDKFRDLPLKSVRH